MRNYRFDIFCGDRFYATMYLRYPEGWVFTPSQLIAEAHDRFPSLKHVSWHFA
jgi:hypothetical protein